MNKVTGYRISSGNFNNDKGERVDYNNILFNIITDSNPKYKGFAPGGELKIKADELLTVTDGITADELIGKEVEFTTYMLAGEPKVASIVVKKELQKSNLPQQH